MNMIQSAKDQIAALTRSAYRAAVQEGLLPDGVETVPAVEIPKDTANGDYTTTFCLAASKAQEPARGREYPHPAHEARRHLLYFC